MNEEAMGTIRIDIAIAKIVGVILEAMKSPEGSIGGSGKLQQLLAVAVMEDGTRMVDCIMGRDVSVGLKFASLIILSLPLLPQHDSISSTSPAFELLPPSHHDALASFTSLHPILPFSLTGSLSDRKQIATAVWKIHRNSHEASIPTNMNIDNQNSMARKRKRDGVDSDIIIISSDTGEGSSNFATTSGLSVAGKKRRNPWLESVKLVLNQFLEGEDLNMETEGLENMIVRLIK